MTCTLPLPHLDKDGKDLVDAMARSSKRQKVGDPLACCLVCDAEVVDPHR